MKEIKTIEFVDTESHESGVAIVRATTQVVSLALSLERDGDIEVFLSIAPCRSLIAALTEAINTASRT